jgi:hypothetical protein
MDQHATINDREEIRTPGGGSYYDNQNALTITKTLDSVMAIFKSRGQNVDQG